MKNKIMFVLFIGLLINPVYAVDDAFIHSDSTSYDFSTSFNTGLPGIKSIDSIYVNDIQNMGKLKKVLMTATSLTTTGEADSAYNPVTFTIDSNVVGNGLFGYSWNLDRTDVYIHLFITGDGLDVSGLSGSKRIMFANGLNIYSVHPSYPTYTATGHLPSGTDKVVFYHNNGCYAETTSNRPYFIDTDYTHIFDFNYTYDYGINRVQMNRNSTYTSIVKIEIDNNEVYNDTVLTTTDLDYINSSYDTWYITNENIFGNVQSKTLIFGDVSTDATLTTDKTYYNTSEQITISYTNIDKIYDECDLSIAYSKCDKPYEVYILYPVTDDYRQYQAKFAQYLYSNLRDETFTLNTSFLSPQNVYVLGIVGKNGYYGLHNDILLMSESFVVYPDDEYLSLSCESETGRSIGNNDKLTIYYKINNNSEIIIKDNDGNIINTYYNIIDEGEIVYTIPGDIEHLNSYPNWKIYLNNTDYPTSFNKGITVYWSLFITPTPTPTYTPIPTPDINISDEIDNLKDEISPIKDLFIGLSGILIDNPDYNKDNIVDENEINHWFNSLIPMCIILLLIVLFLGLRQKRK